MSEAATTIVPTHVPCLEERFGYLNGAREAIDIIALGLVDGVHPPVGRALLCLCEKLRDDLAAIEAALDRHEDAATGTGIELVWGIDCPSPTGPPSHLNGEHDNAPEIERSETEAGNERIAT